MDEERGGEDPVFQTDRFRIYEYKVKRCSRSRPHDWTQCCFAHNGEKAKRRDPRKFAYTGAACPDYRKSASCRRGDQCPFSHGVFESWLHPSRYRTQCCTDGLACKRRVCFFAHQESELRKPEDDPEVLAAQLQAEAIASQESYQQILAAASLESVPEAHPSNPAMPQLNLALIQALLQNGNGGAAAAQASLLGGLTGAEAADRARMYQLQTLLAALQMRAPAPPPPQHAAQQQQHDALGTLDTAALGRLLATNQALVQQQAEQEILQRNSFDAARRNSYSNSSMDGRDGLMGSSAGFMRQHSDLLGDLQPPQPYRRMSMDNLGASSYNPPPQLHGKDPRVLAALTAASQRGGGAAAQAAAADSSFRRSVDMGMLSHRGGRRPGPYGASRQPPLSEQQMQEQEVQAASELGINPELAAAYGHALIRSSSQLDGSSQASGQMSRQESYSMRAASLDQATALSFLQQQGQGGGGAQDPYAAYPPLTERRYSDLVAHHSGQLGSYGQLPTHGSAGHYSTYGQLQAASSGHLSANGFGPQQQQGGFSLADCQSLSSASSSQGHLSEPQPAMPPPTLSMGWPNDNAFAGGDAQGDEDRLGRGGVSAAGSPGRQAGVDGRALLLPSQPSNGAVAYPGAGKPALTYEMSPRTPTAYSVSVAFSQPSPIPEDQPAAWSSQLPTPSGEAGADLMPTLLEQLQLFEAQRGRGGSLSGPAGFAQQQQQLHNLPPSRNVPRNTSFESLSADLPRSISDLNLSEQHGGGRAPPVVPISG